MSSSDQWFKSGFLIPVIFPGSDFFSESGSAKNPDPIRKKRPKTGVKTEKMLYFISSTLHTVLFGQAPRKPDKNHHLELISLLMDGSGLFKPGSRSAKKP